MTRIYAAYKRPPQNKRSTQTGSEEMEKNIPSKPDKKAGVAILVSDKIDLKTKAIKRDRRTLHNIQGKNPSRRHN